LNGVVGQPVDCVLALEVIEHLFYPKILFQKSLKLLKPNGRLIISTPYHGYVKNICLSLINGWDLHFGVDWDGGHIKFFSKTSLGRMAQQAGFSNLHYYGVGRVPWVWKSMIMVVTK